MAVTGAAAACYVDHHSTFNNFNRNNINGGNRINGGDRINGRTVSMAAAAKTGSTVRNIAAA